MEERGDVVVVVVKVEGIIGAVVVFFFFQLLFFSVFLVAVSFLPALHLFYHSKFHLKMELPFVK